MKILQSLSVLAAASVLACPALAQVPYGFLVAAESNNAPDGFRIINPATGDVTEIAEPSGNFLGSADSVAIDAAGGNGLFASAGASIGGPPVWNIPLDANFYSFANLTGQSLPLFGAFQRIHSLPGQTLFTMRNLNDGLWSLASITGAPTQLLGVAWARDIAVLGNKAYVNTYLAGLPSQIWEVDLSTSGIRTVGANYPETLSLGTVGGVLYAGRADGAIDVIDPVSGAAAPFLTSTLGGIHAMVGSVTGTLLFATTNNEVYDASDLSTPVYVSPYTLEDIDVATTDQATRLVYGTGCAGTGAQPELVLTPPPTLGTTWTISMANAAPSSIGGAVLGLTRTNLDLTSIGYPGCTLVADFQVIATAVTSPTGDASASVPIPNNPNIIGTQLDGQFFVLEASGALAMTPGIEGHVR